MYRTIEDFNSDWKNESQSTLKILSVLSDASLVYKVYNEGRSLGFLAWHIVLTLGEMGNKMSLKVSAPEENAPLPKNASKICAYYQLASESITELVKSQWTDSMLKEEIELYGEKWTRGLALSSLIKHEIHHRAQMTVLMRQAGLRVPGVYGPSREEWANFGMKPME
jgi:uncharacterized damage-inducible protein DinB